MSVKSPQACKYCSWPRAKFVEICSASIASLWFARRLKERFAVVYAPFAKLDTKARARPCAPNSARFVVLYASSTKLGIHKLRSLRSKARAQPCAANSASADILQLPLREVCRNL